MALARLSTCAPRAIGTVVISATITLAPLSTAVGVSADPLSTPAPAADRAACASSGETVRHLVVFDEGTRESDATERIEAACGDSVTYYPEIAVAVANSRDAGFTERLGDARSFSAQQRRDASGSSAESRRVPRAEPSTLAPTDPEVVPSTDRSDEQWGMRMLEVPRARSVSAGDPDVVVGVLDSGIDAAHPELAEAVRADLSAGCLSGKPDPTAESWSPSTSGHGTHVAGTIAAAEDGTGITGVAPEAGIASIKVIGDRGYADPEAVVCGLMWAAANSLDVTNSSYVVDPGSLSCVSGTELDVAREAIARAADHATAEGTLNIAATTNDGVNLSPTSAGDQEDGCHALPASLRSMLTVSAVDSDERKATYSSYGLGVVSVAAPGGEAPRCVLSAAPGGYTRVCGTSMAAPYVSGVAALVASANPDHGPEQIAGTLTSSTRNVPCPADYDISGDGKQEGYCSGYSGYNGFYGHGIVDAYAAVDDADSAPSRE
ncbi:Subtilase family protein [Haloechinothrix alba]|uniref:Subtilase family protein n=1 Tax=Haloechinothrix alba TaxID=664784 RepID=A0A238XJF9_9PSEU|nr:S8 family serine peptidase [Haloechinothrix alba]SNR59116.1 Subtilase family protein [Haloechinothrix alba]